MALKQEFDVNLCSNVEIKEEWDIGPTVLQHTNNILTEPVEKQVYKIKNEIGFGSSEIVCNSIKSEYDSNGGISNASHFIPDHSGITIFTGKEYFKEDAGGRKLENVKVSIIKKSSIFEVHIKLICGFLLVVQQFLNIALKRGFKPTAHSVTHFKQLILFVALNREHYSHLLGIE